MNTSGEAADQVMRMMLEGTEVLIKLSGKGAERAFALAYTTFRQQKKTQGAIKLSNMLRSGTPVKVFTFHDRDLAKFKEVAKQYGILYTILKEKDKTGGVFDVFVRADDESKIQRISERFGLARIDSATLKTELIKEKAAREASAAETEQNTSEASEPVDKQAHETAVAEDLLSQEVHEERVNPDVARTDEKEVPAQKQLPSNPPPFEPTSEITSELMGEDGEISHRKKPSVRKKLDEIKKEQAKQKKTEAPERKKTRGKKKKHKER